MLQLKKINLKLSFIAILIALTATTFIANSWIINSLRLDLDNKVDNFANSYKSILEKILNDSLEDPNSNTNDINFFQDHFVKSIDFPLIFSFEGKPIMSQPADLKDSENIKEIMINMAASFNPIDIKIFSNDGTIAFQYKLYYGDPKMISMIKMIPYIELLIALGFILFLSIFYYISRRNSQNALYLGISKETAHQLGTPISSLLGWSDHIKRKGINDEVMNYIDQDINRLKEVSERFSKIGLGIKSKKINLYELLNDIVTYSKNRIPKTKDIKIDMKCGSNFQVDGDRILLSWAFENLIKNSIDAIKSSSGNISIIALDLNKDSYFIDFSDSGEGIPRRYWKKIFKPGYTSKLRGWGVGLSLTNRIIEEIHLGRIYVYSSISGKSTIRVLLSRSI